MSLTLNARLSEQAAFIQATAIGALATTVGDGAYVSLKNYAKVCVVIDVTNATTVTGGVVTLKQATAVAGTGEKALAFTRMLANIDVAASQTMVETAVSNNTFTTDTTNSKRLRYIIEIDTDQLDVDGNFDCFRVDVASMAAATGTVSYILWGARYSGAAAATD
ncbi:MAG: hypothetical protein ACT6S0_04870 [Roseateles sp.]|uniref:hypothetical protein n=1 Tax=Roseateles sp. TaxID=1971397 RepID=UPI004036C8E0